MDSYEGKIFIGEISRDTDENLLREHFSNFGEVLQVTVIRDKATGHNRGFAVVAFSDPAVVDRVLQEKHHIDDREVTVIRKATGRSRGFGFGAFSDPAVIDRVLQEKHIDNREVDVKRNMSREEQNPAGRSGNFDSGANVRTKRIFVEDLPISLTLEEFRAYFETYGPVSDAIMIDQPTQRPRGYGFVSFDSEDSVDRVLHKSFHYLNGKKVEVKRGLPKNANPGVATGGGGAGAASSGGGAGAASGGGGAGPFPVHGGGAGAASGGGGAGAFNGGGRAGPFPVHGGGAGAASGDGGAGAASVGGGGGAGAGAASVGGGGGAGAASDGVGAGAASGGGGAGASNGGGGAGVANGGGGGGGAGAFPVHGGSGGSGYEGYMDSNRYVQPQNTGSGYYPPYGDSGYGYGRNSVGYGGFGGYGYPPYRASGYIYGSYGVGYGGFGYGYGSNSIGYGGFGGYGYPPYRASRYSYGSYGVVGYGGFGGYGYPAGVPNEDPGVLGAQIPSGYGNVEYGNASPGGGSDPGSAVVEQVSGSAINDPSNGTPSAYGAVHGSGYTDASGSGGYENHQTNNGQAGSGESSRDGRLNNNSD